MRHISFQEGCQSLHPKGLGHQESMTTPSGLPIDIKQWLRRDRDVSIESFVVTAVRTDKENPANPNQRLLHWRCGCSYTSSGPGTAKVVSTSIDTRGRTGLIEVQFISKSFVVSGNAAYHWTTPVAKQYTTTDVYNLLLARGLNKYMYNGNGSGCLTWTTAVVEVLEREGVLPVGSKDQLLLKVSEARADPNVWVPDEPGARFF